VTTLNNIKIVSDGDDLFVLADGVKSKRKIEVALLAGLRAGALAAIASAIRRRRRSRRRLGRSRRKQQTRHSTHREIRPKKMVLVLRPILPESPLVCHRVGSRSRRRLGRSDPLMAV
jgi:hypothetical protein